MDRPPSHLKTDDAGWVITMMPEMAQLAGVAEGSLIVFHLNDGVVAADILPPPADELRAEVRDIAGEFADAFVEIKRRDD